MGLDPEGGDKLWRGPELEGVDWTPSPWLGARGRHRKTVRRGVRLSSGRSGKPVQPGAAPSSVCLGRVPWLTPLWRWTGRGQEREPLGVRGDGGSGGGRSTYISKSSSEVLIKMLTWIRPRSGWALSSRMTWPTRIAPTGRCHLTSH